MPSGSENICIEDAALVRRIQEGDVSGFEQLVGKYQDRVYNLCLRMVGHSESARDLAQETFIKAFEAIGRFEHKSGFYTWLFRIAVNLSLSQRRRDGRTRVYSLSGESEDPNGTVEVLGTQAERLGGRVDTDRLEPAEHVRLRETRQAVRDALMQLDEQQRVMVVLRDIEELDYQAIAEVLNLPLGTVRSRLHRARLALKELLEPLMSAGDDPSRLRDEEAHRGRMGSG